MTKLTFLLLTALLFFTAAINAQPPQNTPPPKADNTTGGDLPDKPFNGDENTYRRRRGAKNYGFVLGFSPGQPTFLAEKEYDTTGRKLAMANFHFGRVLGNSKPVTYEYFIEVTPLAVFLKNEVRNPAFVSAAQTPGIARTKRETTYGAGFAPLNFRFVFRPDKRVQPFAQGGAGILVTNKPVPTPDSTKYNLTGDIGGGIRIFTAPNRAVSFGYRYFHISNANLSEINPGYNANVLYFGYSIFK